MNGLVTPSATRCGSRAYYRQLRGKGLDHHGAVRALAFKWIRIVFRSWKERVAYEESKYLAVLARGGSPLFAVVASSVFPSHCGVIMGQRCRFCASLAPIGSTVGSW